MEFADLLATGRGKSRPSALRGNGYPDL